MQKSVHWRRLWGAPSYGGLSAALPHSRWRHWFLGIFTVSVLVLVSLNVIAELIVREAYDTTTKTSAQTRYALLVQAAKFYPLDRNIRWSAANFRNMYNAGSPAKK